MVHPQVPLLRDGAARCVRFGFFSLPFPAEKLFELNLPD